MDGVRQRLLREDVFAQFHCSKRRRGMHVIGSGDGDRINVLALVKQLSPVLISPGFRPLLCCFDIAALAGRHLGHDITEGDQVVSLRRTIHIRPASAADRDRCNVQLFVG